MINEQLKKLIKEEGHYKAFEYKGFKCRIIRNNFYELESDGKPIHLCGYVGIPPNHKYYKKSYFNIDINVHGGLTYSRDYLFFQPEKDLWWIGFDCAHCHDIYSLDDDEIFDYFEESTYKGMDYVTKELESIVDQLLTIK